METYTQVRDAIRLYTRGLFTWTSCLTAEFLNPRINQIILEIITFRLFFFFLLSYFSNSIFLNI